MARSKVRMKKVAKKQNVQAGRLQKQSNFASDGKESGNVGEIFSTVPSPVAEKSVAQAKHPVKPSVFPEKTPVSHRGRAVHVKKLTDEFARFPGDITPVVDRQVIQSDNPFLTSTPKESEVVSRNIQPNIQNGGSARMPETTRTSKRSAETELNETTIPQPKDSIGVPHCSIKLKQRTIDVYYTPVEDTRKWVKEELAKPSPRRKKVARKKLRAPTTDEMTKVLLWDSPSGRRTLRDLTDWEVAYTIFKETVEEFSDCASDRGIKKLLAKYDEYVKSSIVKELQRIEDGIKIQNQIKKLNDENKKLSLNLGSLIDRKIRLQNEQAKRRRRD